MGNVEQYSLRSYEKDSRKHVYIVIFFIIFMYLSFGDEKKVKNLKLMPL